MTKPIVCVIFKVESDIESLIYDRNIERQIKE